MARTHKLVSAILANMAFLCVCMRECVCVTVRSRCKCMCAIFDGKSCRLQLCRQSAGVIFKFDLIKESLEKRINDTLSHTNNNVHSNGSLLLISIMLNKAQAPSQICILVTPCDTIASYSI